MAVGGVVAVVGERYPRRPLRSTPIIRTTVQLLLSPQPVSSSHDCKQDDGGKITDKHVHFDVPMTVRYIFAINMKFCFHWRFLSSP